MPSIIRLPEVMRRTGKSPSSIYRDIEDNRFPSPVCIDTRSKGWIKNEVNLLILQRMQERDRLFGKQFSILPMRLDQCDSLTVISLPEVVRRTGKSRSSIYSDIQKGRFPRAVRLGLRSKGWIDAEVDLWVFERMRERNQSPRRQIRTVPVRLDRTYPTIHHSHDADVGK